MPWRERTTMSERKQFILDYQADEESFTSLCVRYGISAKTGYKWLRRYLEHGPQGLDDQSRRPHSSPRRTDPEIEASILRLRSAHPGIGARKLQHLLVKEGVTLVPAPSTITEILRRRGFLEASEAAINRKAYRRFEKATPNELWQMDFKGHFPLTEGRCHPLTVLDDHSRFCLTLAACPHERGSLVKDKLTAIFRVNGLPLKMTMDNGSPWGRDAEHTLTALTVWLIRLGVRVGHSTPYHPQTQGKDERFHRTLKEECLKYHVLSDLTQAQQVFDEWLRYYNFQRPHLALNLNTPADRYQSSLRAFPEVLPEVAYDSGETVRKVQDKGEIHLSGRIFTISVTLKGYPVAIRPTDKDGIYNVFFCQSKVKTIDFYQTENVP